MKKLQLCYNIHLVVYKHDYILFSHGVETDVIHISYCFTGIEEQSEVSSYVLFTLNLLKMLRALAFCIGAGDSFE